VPDPRLHIPEPAADNDFRADHVTLLLRCHRHWTGRDLLPAGPTPADTARVLYHAPFVVLSHGTAADPVFDYANLAAQRLFEMDWTAIVGLPSRHSAEPVAREERQRLLDRVGTHGYIDDYSGVRIARGGRRFLIRQATVWNLFGSNGRPAGQAASFAAWEYL
jgi:hypothetical protein